MSIPFLLAIDPACGKSSRAGFAQFIDGRLNVVGTVKATGDFVTTGLEILRRNPLAPDVLVLEWPQIYQRGKGKTAGDPNLLTPLAALGGYLAGAYGATHTRVVCVKPAEWKGQMSKLATKARALTRLDDDEKARIPARLAHDGWDAIGIGLHALGRFAPRRVYRGAT